MPSFEIKPLTPELWPDFEQLFGPNRACAGCWCMWWRLRRRDFDAHSGAGKRRAYKAIVAEGPPPGLLAYADGAAVGWCQVTRRDDLPVLDRSHLLKRVDDQPVWSLSCFFVERGWRGRGLTTALTEAAKVYARERGARLLEAYPWDTVERKPGSTIFTGQASVFSRCGFDEVARRVPHRPVMRCRLETSQG